MKKFDVWIHDTQAFLRYILMTREIALMIQLEQQQHREFWVGWVGRAGGVADILPISSSLGLDQLFNVSSESSG